MPPMIFLNLPVTSVARSRAFFEGLGFSVNERFSDAQTACVLLDDGQFAMLLEHERYCSFVDKPIADTHTTSAVLISRWYPSAEAVREICDRAFVLGARRYREPEDLGFMYSWGFEDLDGHIWEVFWMDPAAAEG
jgi:predicted lactoylglutathione lyase